MIFTYILIHIYLHFTRIKFRLFIIINIIRDYYHKLLNEYLFFFFILSKDTNFDLRTILFLESKKIKLCCQVKKDLRQRGRWNVTGSKIKENCSRKDLFKVRNVLVFHINELWPIN